MFFNKHLLCSRDRFQRLAYNACLLIQRAIKHQKRIKKLRLLDAQWQRHSATLKKQPSFNFPF